MTSLRRRFKRGSRATLLVIYRDGLWHVVRSDAKTVSLFSSPFSTAANDWRNAKEEPA